MAGKIEKLGLVKRIEELIMAGTNSSEGIAAALKAEGYAISQPTISRYLKRTREERREETQKIISDHVQATVPADLTALETMEAQCLAWAQEENDSFAHRLAGRNIAQNLTAWLDRILTINPASHTDPEELDKARRQAVKEIMGDCLLWIADEFSIQKARLSAMRQAAGIIDLKLRYAGLIDVTKEGNVFILGSEDRLEKDPQTGRFLVIKGGTS
jgi:predicted transcriptional regulator